MYFFFGFDLFAYPKNPGENISLKSVGSSHRDIIGRGSSRVERERKPWLRFHLLQVSANINFKT